MLSLFLVPLIASEAAAQEPTASSCEPWVIICEDDQRYAPVISLIPHNGESINPSLCGGCFDAVVSYSTPSYVSLDQERSLTFLFANAQARPSGFVQVNATDQSAAPPNRMSIRVLDPSGASVTFSNGLQENFYHSGSGTWRLAAHWDASAFATGAYYYTVVVRSYWDADQSFLETSAGVRVLIVNERGSPYGLGWSVPGVQRVHPQGNGHVLITDGDGSARFFSRGGCNTDPWTGAVNCSFVSPLGDFSTVTSEQFAGWTTWKRLYPGGSEVRFGSDGLQSERRDRFGNTTSYSHFGGRLVAVTDPAGLSITLGYHGGGGLAWVRDPGGRQVNTAVAYGLLFHFTDPDGEVGLDIDFAGDHLNGYWPHRKGRWDGGDPARWHFTYDHARRLASMTAPTIDVNGQPARPVTSYRSLEARVLPPSGTGSVGSAAPGVSTAGVHVAVTDPRQNATTVTLDRFGEPTRIAEPLGRLTHLARNSHSQVTQLVTPSGNTIDYRWSGPNLIRVHDHGTSRVDTMSYVGSRLREHSVLSAIGGFYYPLVTYHHRGAYTDSVTVYSGVFSQSGSFNILHPGGGARQAIEMDGRGRVTAVTDASGNRTQYSFSPTGWMNTASTVAPGGRQTTYTPDAYGRVETITNPLGYSTTVVYDLINRVRRTVEPGGVTTRYEYGAAHLDSVIDAVGQVYRYGTNALGWVERETDPRGLSDLYRFDASGNMIRWTNRRGQQIDFTFDALDQLTSRTADGGTVTYHTHPSGLFQAVQVPGVSTDTIHFDPAGRAVRQIAVHGGRRHELVSGFDHMDDRHSVELVGSGAWHRTSIFQNYINGQLYELTDPAGGKTRVGYDPRRLATTYTLPTGNVVTIRYPSTRQAAHVSHSITALSNAFGVNYTQDKLIQTRSRSSIRGDSTRELYYDALGRLTGVEDYQVSTSTGDCFWRWDPDSGQFCESETHRQLLGQPASYAYDDVGNRTDRSASLQAGGGNRLVGFDGYTMSYDVDGNLQTKTGPGGWYHNYTWNSLGQLTSVSTHSGTVHYQYNGWGDLISRTDAGGTVRYVYDGDNLFMETIDGWAQPHRVYTNYPGTDRPHSVQVWTPGSVEQTYYFATDYPGNVLGLFNASNQIINRYRYDAWGHPEVYSEALSSPTQYAGRYRDWGTGLYYNRMRWYDSHTGRFISQDPLGLAAGINLYAYAGNNPVDFNDPYGLFRLPRWVGGGIGIASFAFLGTSAGFGGTAKAFAATAAGSAMAAGVQSLVTGESFGDIFFHNFGISTGFMGISGAMGGVDEIGANGWFQGYLKTSRSLGGGALTLGSAAVLSDVTLRNSAGPGLGTFAQHERGHTIQFILLSATGQPWRYYLAAGGAGAAGQWLETKGRAPKLAGTLMGWERMASWLGRF